MVDKLSQRVVVVTGGAGLIGRAFVKALAAAGATAIVADIDLAAAQALSDELNCAGYSGRVDHVALNICVKESVAGCIDTCIKQHGAIHAVVNNAYPRNDNFGRPMFEVEYEDFCENLNLHLGGYFLVAQQFARYFKAQGRGSIVNMASIYGVVAPRFEIYNNTAMTLPAEYAVIKAGIIHLTRYLAAYLKGTGIRVNSISPGGILDQQPEAFLEAYRARCASKGMLTADDLTETLLYLLSDGAAAVNGQNIVVDDGFVL